MKLFYLIILNIIVISGCDCQNHSQIFDYERRFNSFLEQDSAHIFSQCDKLQSYCEELYFKALSQNMIKKLNESEKKFDVYNQNYKYSNHSENDCSMASILFQNIIYSIDFVEMSIDSRIKALVDSSLSNTTTKKLSAKYLLIYSIKDFSINDKIYEYEKLGKIYSENTTELSNIFIETANNKDELMDLLSFMADKSRLKKDKNYLNILFKLEQLLNFNIIDKITINKFLKAEKENLINSTDYKIDLSFQTSALKRVNYLLESNNKRPN